MTKDEIILSFIRRIKVLRAYYSNYMCGARCDYGMKNNNMADTYEKCLDNLHDMFPDVLSSDGVFYDINTDNKEYEKPITKEDINK